MWQSVLAVVHLHASLALAGLCTNTLSPFDTMSCLPIMSDRAATERSKYFELGGSPTSLLT